MVDNIYRTRSLGTAAEGLRDQYADGKAARVWEVYIGDKSSRTENYRNFITSLLKEKKCHTVLDLACGTGYHLIYFYSCKLVCLQIIHKKINYDLFCFTGLIQ
jgi:hypothetical protein